jgi:STAS domain
MTASELVFAIRAPIRPDDLTGLSDRISELLEETRPDVVHCDVGRLEPDAVAVDALLRLRLAVQRRGCCLRLLNASPELFELVVFMGFEDVLCD